MLRRLFCIFVASFGLVVCFMLAMVSMALWRDAGITIWWARRIWSSAILWAGGAKLEVQGREHVDQARPTLYVSNHQSTIDIPVLFAAIPINLRFVATHQLKYVPLLGWFMLLTGFIFVDRRKRIKAIRSLDRGAEHLRKGVSLIVYPEGSRSPNGLIRPFERGAFALAIKAGVAVCPVTIEGCGRLMPKNNWRITPGPIKVKIGAPIDASRYSDEDRERLVRDVRQIMVRQSLELGGHGSDLTDDVPMRDSKPGLIRSRTGAA